MLPLLPSMTLFANHLTILFVLLLVPNGLLFYSPMPKSGTPLPMRKPPVSSNSTSSSQASQVRIPPLPKLTTYRAPMMYITILSILRVVGDFPYFLEILWIMKPFEFFGMRLRLWLRFSHLTLKNVDGPWCRIFCVIAKRCICYTTYQRLLPI